MKGITFNKKEEREKYGGLCYDCAKVLYPAKERKRAIGNITVSINTCPRCQRVNVPIVPRRDFEYAVADNPGPEEWD